MSPCLFLILALIRLCGVTAYPQAATPGHAVATGILLTSNNFLGAPTDTSHHYLKRDIHITSSAAAVPPDFKGYIGPDNTCGFASNDLRIILTCGTSYSCVVPANEVGKGPAVKGYACCSDGACEWNTFTACLQFDTLFSSSCIGASACDGVVTRCSADDSRYCITLDFSGPWGKVPGWGCAGGRRSLSSREFSITLSGQRGRTWYAQDVLGFTEIESTSTPLASTPLETAELTISGITSGSSADGVGPISSQPTTADSSTSSTSTSAASQSGPPIGAIVGGAVGGFAVLAIMVVALFYIHRRSPVKTDREGHTQAPPILPPPPPSVPQSPASESTFARSANLSPAEYTNRASEVLGDEPKGEHTPRVIEIG